MSNFSAIIPVANMDTANSELEALGYGPNNFSVPAFNGPNPGYGLLHSWNDPGLLLALSTMPGVILSTMGGDPADLVTEVTTDVGATWADNAQPLTGVVTPGLYRYSDNSLWWVIQQYDSAIWPDPYAPGLTALVVPARVPGEVTQWVQPFNQFTAYYLVNAFTGLPDQVTHNGGQWKVSQGDGAGLNVWEPGAFGWELIE